MKCRGELKENYQTTARFNFRPYETDSEFDGKPHAFTRAFWQGEEREFALALVDRYVRFCEVDKLESGEWNFAVDDRINHFSDTNINPDFVKHVFKTGLEAQQIVRLFCLQEGVEDFGITTQWILVKPNSHIALRIGRDKNFEPQTDISVMDTPTSQWFQEILRLRKGDSDFAFSLRWNGLGNYERAWILTRLKNGERGEVESIARLLLCLEKEFMDEDVEHVTAMVKLGMQGKLSSLQSILPYWTDFDFSGSKIHSPQFGNEFQISKKYRPLWEVFLRYYEPQVDTQICQQYSSAKAADRYTVLWLEADTALTLHEQLELRFQIAEWLKGKVPDEQIDSLLEP